MPRAAVDHSSAVAEYQPFIETAKAKGLSLSFGGAARSARPDLWRLDMDLVRLSIASAIARATQQGMDPLVQRLEHLLDAGTDVQHVDFVLGDRRTYYFPEDIEKMVQSGPSASHPCTVYPFSWLRCQPLEDGSQHLEEHHKRIGLIDDPIGSLA
jgi:hypothetical protein